jgi:transposase
LAEIYIPKHQALINHGRLSLLNQRMMDCWLSHFYTGQRVEVIIREPRPLRPDWMRRYYFGFVVEPLADFLGYRTAEMHDELKEVFCKVPAWPEWWEVESTTRMSRQGMWDRIEHIKQWAAETLDFQIPKYEAAHVENRMLGEAL